MKRIAFIVFGCLLSQVLANGPGEAAIDFLNKVKAGNLDLKPGGDTALQAHTSQDKIQTIRRHLETLAGDLDAGVLELGAIREDGEFAAVIVRQIGDFSDSHLQVFPVAMVKEKSGWSAAPVLASFENSVQGYTVQLGARLATLENWMMLERVLDLQQLVLKSGARTRERIKNSIVGENLEGSDLIKITNAFLKACEERNQAAILGFLGGLSEPLPNEWKDIVIASEVTVSEDSKSELPWRLLVSPEVIRIPVHEEFTGDEGMVSIACLDPKRADRGGTLEKLLLLHFDFQKDPQGRWMIDLPDSLLRNDTEEIFQNEGMDLDLLDEFARRLRDKIPLRPSATAESAEAATIVSLKSEGLLELMGRVDMSANPKDARVSCAEAAAMWWTLNEPGNFRAPIRLGFRQEGNLAVGVFQWFSASQADRFEMETLFFKKIEGGWIWLPRVVAARESDSQEILFNWIKEREPEWRMSWRDSLLQSSLKISSLPLKHQASDEQVRTLIEGWLGALEDRNIKKALGFTAWLGKEQEMPLRILRNLAYELANARRAVTKISGIYRSDVWVAVGIGNSKSDQTSHSFVPVLMTEKGPRLVPEIDLIVGENRTRDFLNGTSFDRLGDFVGKKDLDELRRLFENFQNDVNIK